MILTIGLQYRFRSLQWLSTTPPIFFILAYKIYINRTYVPTFQYFIPTEEEIREAKVYSERSDARGNRLERRFGHPALYTDLFTPMLHAKMMPFLAHVYQGKIGKDEAKLDEYGGQKMEAQIIPGGIKIAAITQNDLEYDPALYQRDRGELDWDARSVTTTLYDGNSPIKPGASPYAASTTSLPRGIDRYLAEGPQQHQSPDIELAFLDSTQEPLLSPQSYNYYQQQQASQQSLSSPQVPQSHYRDPVGSSREAPTHRPQSYSYYPEQSPAYSSEYSHEAYPSYPPMRTNSPQQQYPPPQQQPSYGYHSRQSSNNNLAGRGPYRG